MPPFSWSKGRVGPSSGHGGSSGAVGARPAGVVDEQMIVRDSGAAKCVNLGDFILRSSRDTSIAKVRHESTSLKIMGC